MIPEAEGGVFDLEGAVLPSNLDGSSSTDELVSVVSSTASSLLASDWLAVLNSVNDIWWQWYKTFFLHH
jgi:hypothetical protein